MLNIKDIEASIEYYEKQPSSLENCRILADLYTCKKYATMQSHNKENGFRSAYKDYINIKRDYQLHKESKENLLNSMEHLSIELSNLISTIYKNMETQEGRNILKSTIEKVLETL